MSFTKIIPGQVINNGMDDKSRLNPVTSLPTYPCHYPVISVVTPKGELGQSFINSRDFTNLYGDILDVDTPYYSAVSQLISMITSGGQGGFGVRRVSANTVVARVAYAIAIGTGTSIPQYRRATDGSYLFDDKGELIPVTGGTVVPGVYVKLVKIDVTAPSTPEYGKLAKSTFTETVNKEEVTFTQYPFFELPAGVGDAYNLHGLTMGLNASTDWDSVSDFVEEYGVFPFSMRMYVKSATGVPTFFSNINGGESATYTLFTTKDKYDVRYSLATAVGDFTNANVNRQVTLRPAPFYEVKVYDQNIQEVCAALYAAELAAGKSALVNVTGVNPIRQMNPFTLTNHTNVPYYACMLVDDANPFANSGYIDAAGGISPFLKADRTTPVPVEGTYNFDPATNNGHIDQLSTKDAWTVAQSLYLSDIQAYAQSSTVNDWTRNRQSVIWDVGYNLDIKNALIELWNTRKDQILILQASEWLENNTIAQRYSMMQSLATKIRLYPESSLYGTPASRAAISLWDAKIIDESTGLEFPQTLDLAYFFARLGGNSAGNLSSVNSPDHGDNRILTQMHSPTMDFEGDDAAANNFDEGGISLRPYNTSQYYRPALPTVYDDNDAVLKDLITNFTAVCIEKVIADAWTLVSGDTTIDATTYASTVKDTSEAAIRRRMGTMFKDLRVDCTYNEIGAGSRAVLNSVGNVWFRKGKYMMNMSLAAYNEEDLDTTNS